MDTTKSVFARHRSLIFFVLGVIIAFGILYVLRSVLLPFVFGLALAYLLLPLISWIEIRLPRRGGWLQAKRVTLIILIYIIILGLVGLLSYYIATAVVGAISVLLENASVYIAGGLFSLREWAEGLRQQFPPEMQQQVDEFLLEVGVVVGNAIRGLFTRGVSLIPGTFSLIFGFVALPIFVFYVMKDWEKLGRGFYSAFSPWLAEHVRGVVQVIEEVLGRYIRAQLLLGFIVAYLCFIGLLILRIPFAPALAAFAGMTELIPILGPWMGGAAAVIVTLALVPSKAIWVILLYFLVQLLENNLLVPRIQGSYLRVHPAVVLVLLGLGAYLAGFWGLIFAVPLAATIVEIYKYIRRSAEAEKAQQSPRAEAG